MPRYTHVMCARAYERAEIQHEALLRGVLAVRANWISFVLGTKLVKDTGAAMLYWGFSERKKHVK